MSSLLRPQPRRCKLIIVCCNLKFLNFFFWNKKPIYALLTKIYISGGIYIYLNFQYFLENLNLFCGFVIDGPKYIEKWLKRKYFVLNILDVSWYCKPNPITTESCLWLGRKKTRSKVSWKKMFFFFFLLLQPFPFSPLLVVNGFLELYL